MNMTNPYGPIDVASVSPQNVEECIHEYLKWNDPLTDVETNIINLESCIEIDLTFWRYSVDTDYNTYALLWGSAILIGTDEHTTFNIKLNLKQKGIRAFYPDDFEYEEAKQRFQKIVSDLEIKIRSLGHTKTKPAKPTPGSSDNAFFDWYHAMIDNGFDCDLKEIATEIGHTYGYTRQLHTRYKHERGISDT